MGNDIGSYLRTIRLANQMSQVDVCRRMAGIKGGIRHRVSLTQIESGTYRPTLSKLDALAHGYRLTLAQKEELKRILSNAEVERKVNRSDHKRGSLISTDISEPELILLLLRLSKEVRDRIIRTIQTYDDAS